MTKYFTFKDLLSELKKAGLTSSKKAIMHWEEKGWLKVRRLPYSKKHKRRVFTKNDLEEIVKAFGPEGKGSWSYKNALKG